jgi:hypothetical protein
MASDRKQTSSSKNKEVDSVLNRLHSGCRFISYTDKHGGIGKESNEDRTHNALRNLSHPDEVHAEIGRALAFSYVKSLRSIWTLLDSDDVGSGELQAVVGRGVNIIQSLVCGEELSQEDDKQRELYQENYNKANYASAASSYFNHLFKLIFENDGTDEGSAVEHEALCSFVKSQWQHWCIRCEEFAYAKETASSFTGGGGFNVLNDCLKRYGSICFLDISSNKKAEVQISTQTSAAVYQSLKQTTSRKFWIKICVSNAVELVIFIAAEPPNLLVESLSSDGVEVLNSRGIETDKVFVDSLSPLFYACVLQARHNNDQRSEMVHDKHTERRLLLHEMLRGCSLLMRGVKEDDAFITNQIAWMVQYLSTSLLSYFGQIVNGIFSGNNLEVNEFSHGWLNGICDVIQLILSKHQFGKNSTTVDLLSISCETILRHFLPQITSNVCSGPVSFDVTSIYSAVLQIASSLPKHKLLDMADANLALYLGTLALGLHNDDQLEILCILIAIVFESFINCEASIRKVYVPSDVTVEGQTLITVRQVKVSAHSKNAMPSASDMLWIGGILCSLGNVMHPRLPTSAVGIKKLGETILGKAHTTLATSEEKGDERVNVDAEYHLVNILSRAIDDDKSSGGLDYQCLIRIMSASISNIYDETVLLHNWKRRPLSLSEQYFGTLLLGLFWLISYFTSDSQFVLYAPSSLDRTFTSPCFGFIRCARSCFWVLAITIDLPSSDFRYVHLSLSSTHSSLLTLMVISLARVVPSVIDLARTCTSTATSSRLLLKAMEFLSSSAVVSDPHGASIAWNFLSSLTGDSNPSSIRSTVLRILPTMCASNKKLRSRIRAIIGKSLVSTYVHVFAFSIDSIIIFIFLTQ